MMEFTDYMVVKLVVVFVAAVIYGAIQGWNS